MQGVFSKEQDERIAGGVRELEDVMSTQGRERRFRIRSTSDSVENRQTYSVFS